MVGFLQGLPHLLLHLALLPDLLGLLPHLPGDPVGRREVRDMHVFPEFGGRLPKPAGGQQGRVQLVWPPLHEESSVHMGRGWKS